MPAVEKRFRGQNPDFTLLTARRFGRTLLAAVVVFLSPGQSSCSARGVRRKAATLSQLRTHEHAVVGTPTGTAPTCSAHVLVADGNAASRARRQLQLEEAGFRV